MLSKPNSEFRLILSHGFCGWWWRQNRTGLASWRRRWNIRNIGGPSVSTMLSFWSNHGASPWCGKTENGLCGPLGLCPGGPGTEIPGKENPGGATCTFSWTGVCHTPWEIGGGGIHCPGGKSWGGCGKSCTPVILLLTDCGDLLLSFLLLRADLCGARGRASDEPVARWMAWIVEAGFLPPERIQKLNVMAPAWMIGCKKSIYMKHPNLGAWKQMEFLVTLEKPSNPYLMFINDLN